MKRMKCLYAFCVCLSIALMSLPCWATDPLDVWHQLDSPTTNTLWSVAYGNNYLYAVGGDVGESVVVYSQDHGAHWLKYPLVLDGGMFYGVSFGFGHFVAVGLFGDIYTDWLQVGSDTSNHLFAVQSNRLFCAAGANGTVTCDGESGAYWSEADWTGTTEDLMGIACPDTGPCIAVGANGVISNSQWGLVESGTSNDLLAAAWGNDTFVAVGLFSTILKSHDGVNWDVVNPGGGLALGGVTYANGTFLAVGTVGQILTSTDGEGWAVHDMSSHYHLHSATFDSANNTWVVVGTDGAIFQSDPITSVPTDTGTDITVEFPDAGTTITFPEVTSEGNTYVNTSSDVYNAPVSNFSTCDPMTYYDIHTTATFTPPATVCIYYDYACSNPENARLLHRENGQWVDVTTSNDTDDHVVCGEVNSFSLFGVVQRPVDNPPVITDASASPAVLWPPNNKIVDVTINYTATDDWSTPTCEITSVTANEPISSSDYQIVDAHHVKLIAQRLGSGNGRNYDVTITCVDDFGQSSTQTVTVIVPHDQGRYGLLNVLSGFGNLLPPPR
jgi:hypothetical protein